VVVVDGATVVVGVEVEVGTVRVVEAPSGSTEVVPANGPVDEPPQPPRVRTAAIRIIRRVTM
jgi:hypothetical protein